MYKNVKTPEEFHQMKNDIKGKLRKFISEYDQFVKSVSPSNWRSTGHHYQALKIFCDDIDNFEPVTTKHLDQEWVRDQVLTDEEKEMWNDAKKYNL